MDERPTDVLSRHTQPWGGVVVSDDDLLVATLMTFGVYASDDGQLTILRALGEAEHSTARFTGYCDACARARLIPPTGQALSDVRAAVQFAAVHHHADVD